MSVDFISWCSDCLGKVRYVNWRPEIHDCIGNENDSDNEEGE